MAKVTATLGAFVNILADRSASDVRVRIVPNAKDPIAISALNPLAKLDTFALVVLDFDKSTSFRARRAIKNNIDIFSRRWSAMITTVRKAVVAGTKVLVALAA